MIAKISSSLCAVIEAMRKLAKIHSVYVIGQQDTSISGCCSFYPDQERQRITHIYTLLVVSHDLVENPQQFMNEVCNKTHRTARFYSIHYTYNETVYRLTEGNNFLSLVMGTAYPVYQENSSLKSYSLL